jgi:hypothetical protein
MKGNNPCWELASKPVDHKCASFNCSCPSPSFNFKCVCGLQITLIAVIDNAWRGLSSDWLLGRKLGTCQILPFTILQVEMAIFFWSLSEIWVPDLLDSSRWKWIGKSSSQSCQVLKDVLLKDSSFLEVITQQDLYSPTNNDTSPKIFLSSDKFWH